LPRAFRVPIAIIICPLGAAACLYLFVQTFADNWHWMSAWIAIGILIYVFYGAKRSVLQRAQRESAG
jgi:APA family basic amino acid/polyamine antiporter